MGLMDRRQKLIDEQQRVAEYESDAAPQVMAKCPGQHFQTEVNKGSINMMVWQQKINDRYQAGYRLTHVFEQDGNTVQVFEHHLHD